MKILFTIVSIFGVSLAPLPQVHVFTDDLGHKVEAMPVGQVNGNVILSVNGVRGQWPIERLTDEDRVYIGQWQEDSEIVAKVDVEIMEKDGLGNKGAFQGKPAAPGEAFSHYDMKIINPAAIDATNLRVDYIVYVIRDDGTVGTCDGTQYIPKILANHDAVLQTEGLSLKNIETTGTQLTVPNPSKARRMGGAWVRVTNLGCRLLRQFRVLDPELDKLNPLWNGPDAMKGIVKLKSLAELAELAKQKSGQASPGSGS